MPSPIKYFFLFLCPMLVANVQQDWSQPSYARSNLRGVVTSSDGKPVSDALVRLIPERKGATTYKIKTNNKGFFCKTGLEVYHYVIVVSAEGYITSKPMKVGTPGTAIRNIKIVLDPASSDSKK